MGEEKTEETRKIIERNLGRDVPYSRISRIERTVNNQLHLDPICL